MNAVRRFVAWAASTCAMTTLMVVPWTPKPSLAAAPDFPITELRWLLFHRDNEPVIRFVVPDQDTTISAYGGALRRYDVHVAKMFEVTYHFCEQVKSVDFIKRDYQGSDGINWFYRAAGGRVYMGRFKITCSQAYDVAKTFGLDRFEQTAIQRELLNEDTGALTLEAQQYAIPVLNITAKKISRWMNFVQKVSPDFSVAIANNKLPMQDVLRQMHGKTMIPIFLPEQISEDASLEISEETSFDTHYISAKATAASYYVEISAIPDCMSAGVCYRTSISANRDGKFKPPGPYWKRFEHVKLAPGIDGIAATSCGAYCLSVVQWKYQGILYEIHSKAGSDRLIKMANSAIAAGPR